MGRSAFHIASLAIVILAAGCGGDDATGPTLAPDLDTIITAAAETMGSVDTVQFGIERGGAPVYIDPLDTLAFVSADGRFAAPDSADALLVVSVGDLRAQIGAVAIDGATWLTNPITGDWELAPDGYTFDPATLFDPELGWRPLLADDLSGAELIGLEDRGGTPLYHVRGNAPEDRISLITAGLVGQDVIVDLWIDPVTGAVAEAEFDTEYRGDLSDWRLTFTGYGEPLTIEVPDLPSEG
jgi:lipoprotein LprG